jgi:vesicle-fusing ATPase
VSVEAGTWEIGGLHNLKKWLKERGEAFSPAVARHGLTPPKGILVMGVSGCGKSLCIKAIATYWKLPLLRLDMGRLYDGLAGPPEEAMRNAIKTAEAVAPCVLWIDEIEAGIANQQQKAAGGSESRVLALFLTWMQEKTAPVFVGATANEVEVLPPEVLRKGRFDELFYMGLPSKEERREILSIHMKKRNLDPDRYDMDYLAESTTGFNGAELEQGVVSAIFEGLSQESGLSEHVLANCLRNVVPLSRTMRERIEKIEAWARDRAMKASLSAFDTRP